MSGAGSRLANKIAIVTGSGSGIGRAIALRFAAEGASVTIAELDEARGSDTLQAIEQSGGRGRLVQADVAKAQDAERIASATLDHFGRIDILVNNAAVGGGDDILATDEATWDRIQAVVLKSVFLCCRATLPSMLQQGAGSIVNVSSVNGLLGLGEEAYSAAKAGVINLTRNLAVRYGSAGVRANVICPGTIRTPIWQARVDRQPDIFERLSAWYPVGRVGEPMDVAEAALFLASDAASFVSGTMLTVDGGLTAGLARMARELEGD